MLYVADSPSGQVWSVGPDPDGTEPTPVTALPGLSGIAYDEAADCLYLATATASGVPGRLWRFTTASEAPRLHGELRADFSSLTCRGGRVYAPVATPPPGGDRVLVVEEGGRLADEVVGLDEVVAPGQVDVLGAELLFVPDMASDRIYVARLPTAEQ